jgi:ubiquinone/menaquinone biosynthesis C-methylase UbiE
MKCGYVVLAYRISTSDDRLLPMKSLIVLGIAACSHATPAPQTQPMHHHDHAQPMHHRFERADDWAKVFDDPARDAWQQPDKVVAALAITPGMTVADLGAGTGYFEARISAAVGPSGRVIAADVEPDMVRYLAERAAREKTPNVEAHLSQADDPKLDAVDRILIVDTWHHIADREAYAKKLAAALKPGGFVLVVDFTQESDKGPPKEHRIPAAQVMAELQSAGLTAKLVDVGLPDQFVVSAAK